MNVDRIIGVLLTVGLVLLVASIGWFIVSFPSSGTGGTLELRPVNDSLDAPVTTQTALRGDQRQLIDQARANDGSATAYGYDPGRTLEQYVLLEGIYYRVDVTRTADTAHVEKPVLVVEPTANASDAVPLTEYTHHVVELVVPASGSNGSHTVVLQPDTQGRGELLPTPHHESVTWENETYSVRVENRTVEQSVYTVSTSVVATTESAFTEYLIENEVTVEMTSDQFSEGERDILQRAIDERYFEEKPFSEAFEGVLTALFGEVDRSYEEVFVRYDGRVYRATIGIAGWG